MITSTITAIQYLVYWFKSRELRQAWRLSVALGYHCRPTESNQPKGTAWGYRSTKPQRLFFTWSEYRHYRKHDQWSLLMQWSGPNVNEDERGLWDLDHPIVKQRVSRHLIRAHQ
jgi:hypothetical protein